MAKLIQWLVSLFSKYNHKDVQKVVANRVVLFGTDNGRVILGPTVSWQVVYDNNDRGHSENATPIYSLSTNPMSRNKVFAAVNNDQFPMSSSNGGKIWVEHRTAGFFHNQWTIYPRDVNGGLWNRLNLTTHGIYKSVDEGQSYTLVRADAIGEQGDLCVDNGYIWWVNANGGGINPNKLYRTSLDGTTTDDMGEIDTTNRHITHVSNTPGTNRIYIWQAGQNYYGQFCNVDITDPDHPVIDYQQDLAWGGTITPGPDGPSTKVQVFCLPITNLKGIMHVADAALTPVGDLGSIWYTSDGGHSWTQTQADHLNLAYRANQEFGINTAATDGQDVWCASKGNKGDGDGNPDLAFVLFHSTDQGATWNEVDWSSAGIDVYEFTSVALAVLTPGLALYNAAGVEQWRKTSF